MAGTSSLIPNASTTIILRTLYQHNIGLKTKPANQDLVDKGVVLDARTAEAGRKLRTTSSQVNRTAEAIHAGLGHLMKNNSDDLNSIDFTTTKQTELKQFMEAIAGLNKSRDELISEYQALPPHQKSQVLALVKENEEGKRATTDAISQLDTIDSQHIATFTKKVDEHIKAISATQTSLDALSHEIFARIDDRSKLSQTVTQEVTASMQRRSGQ